MKSFARVLAISLGLGAIGASLLKNKCLMLALAVFWLTACGPSGAAPEEPLSNFFEPIPEKAVYPTSNPYSADKEKLGELLFWDPILSGNKDVACATCHHPDFAWADGIKVSIGVDGQGLGPKRTGKKKTEVNSPSVANVAFFGLQTTEVPEGFVSGKYFWDLRADTLEEQAIGPIKNDIEMLGGNFTEENIIAEVISRLKAIDGYEMLFSRAFPEQENPITEANIAKAMATFQRKITTPRTRFDDYLAGNQNALSDTERTGLNKFVNAGCARCHSGPLLSDFKIHEGQSVIEGEDPVRTASLRNVALTAPYLRDGAAKTLADVLEVYEDRDDELELRIGDGDFEEIIAFLKTLTSEGMYKETPKSVPSGLPVGGYIDNMDP